MVVLAELLLVDYSYSKTRMAVHQSYFDTLQSQGVLETKRESSFLNYRVPIIGPNILFGPGIFHAKKTAFPDGKLYYYTTHYYDYLVNVDITKQFTTSSILYPILRFIPIDKAVFLPDKYAVVSAINQTSLAELGNLIFIENNIDGEHVTNETLYSKTNFRQGALSEANLREALEKRLMADSRSRYISHLDQLKKLKSPETSLAPFEIVDFNSNQIIVDVTAPEEGYVFFGDGFHKHWKAFVDGEKQQIYKTNINFKSVFVPKGKHNVIFKFDPKPFKYAAIASIITQFFAFLFILLALWLLSRNSPIITRKKYWPNPPRCLASKQPNILIRFPSHQSYPSEIYSTIGHLSERAGMPTIYREKNYSVFNHKFCEHVLVVTLSLPLLHHARCI